LADIDRGTAVDRSRQTVAETVHYWLETYARPNLRPKTVQTYAEVIETHLVPGLGHIAVQGLTSVQVQAFYSRMLAEGIGPWTVRYCHQRLSQALKQAMRLGIVVRNVCEAVDPPRLPSHEMQTWDAAQARHFLDVAGESGYGPIWVLALATGMRRGELLGLRWGDVDLERGLVHIRQTVVRVGTGVAFSRTKSASGRRSVRIQPAVVALLRAPHTEGRGTSHTRGGLAGPRSRLRRRQGGADQPVQPAARLPRADRARRCSAYPCPRSAPHTCVARPGLGRPARTGERGHRSCAKKPHAQRLLTHSAGTAIGRGEQDQRGVVRGASRIPAIVVIPCIAATERHDGETIPGNGIARDRLFCVYGGRYDRAPLGTTPVRAYRHPWPCPLPFAYRNRAACR